MAEAKDKKATPKAAAKDKTPAKPKAQAKTDGKAEAGKPVAAAKAAAITGAAPAGPTCSVDKCKQAARAKGYCRKHYMGWRRGEVGKHHRYKTCAKEGCRKPREVAGFCGEHAGRKPAEVAEAAVAPAPA